MTAVSKMALIERISEMNRSARAEFLAEFEEAELQQYLANLEAVWGDFQQQFFYNTESSSSYSEFEPALMAG